MEEVLEVSITEPARKATRRRARKQAETPPEGPPPETQQQQQQDPEAIKRTIMPVVPALYFALGKLQAAIASVAAKVPHDVASRVMEFTDGEVAQLTEPTAAVLAKHADGLARHVDEVRLALLLLAVEEGKLRRLADERAHLRAKAAGKVNAGAGASPVAQQTDRDLRSEQPVPDHAAASS